MQHNTGSLTGRAAIGVTAAQECAPTRDPYDVMMRAHKGMEAAIDRLESHVVNLSGVLTPILGPQGPEDPKIHAAETPYPYRTEREAALEEFRRRIDKIADTVQNLVDRVYP